MAGDRARITHFPPRKYREVVSLQGRVLLEADWNEGQRIFTEALRLQARDLVGPCGTPDNGYQVLAPATDFTVGPGTMYTSGLRTTLEQALTYSAQSDWLDTAAPQPWTNELWRPPAALAQGNSHVMLLLHEQELTATEDPALREVALGGPDTAARTRLLQRIVTAPAAAATCAGAAAEMAGFWSAHGLEYNAASAALRSRARLGVTMVTSPASPSPCDPPAASGYLGADNQLLRVQLVAFDAATGKGKLLWALNNGSTLYRCRPLDAATIELASRPVSAEFEPRAGAVVQVLMAAAELGEGAYAAAVTGHWARLSAPYDAETRRLTLPAALPALLFPAPAGVPLFLRLWDDEVDFTLDTPATLAGTGLQVTLSRASPGNLHLGDHWSIGARPATPNAVYPERYLSTPQPPDGPRMWVCSLAVLQALPAGGLRTDDCRVQFDTLPELTGGTQGDCCCITVGPDQAAGLQGIIDAAASADDRRVTVNLQAGVYALPEPLRLDFRHRGLTLAPCTGAAPLLKAADPEKAIFSYGLVVALAADELSLRGIDFELPAPPMDADLRGPFESAATVLPLDGWVPERFAVGVRAVRCLSLSIEDCHFRFPETVRLFATGVLLQGDNGHIAVRRCRFSGTRIQQESLTLGVCHAPVLRNAAGLLHVSSTEVLRVEQCLFALLHAAIVLSGQPLHLAVDDNLTREVLSSLLLLRYVEGIANGRTVFATMDARAASPLFRLVFDRMRGHPPTMRALAATLLLATGTLPLESLRREFIYTLGGLKAGVDGGPAAPVSSDLVLRANRFDSAPALTELKGGIDTMVWDLIADDTTRLLVAGNSVGNQSLLPAMLLALDGSFNVTGNLIRNPAVGDDAIFALFVQPRDLPDRTDPFTVTGNTIDGATNLDHFPRAEWRQRMPPEFFPMLTWEFFNALG